MSCNSQFCLVNSSGKAKADSYNSFKLAKPNASGNTKNSWANK